MSLLVNSDAHGPEELNHLRLGVFVARRGWVQARDLLNAQPWTVLRDRRLARLRRMGLTVSVSQDVTPSPATEQSIGSVATAGGPAPVARLRQRLTSGTIDAELRQRLEAFMRASGSDPELETALNGLTDNPLQLAFNLLFAAKETAPETSKSDVSDSQKSG